MLFVYLQFPSITFLSMIVTSYNEKLDKQFNSIPEDGDCWGGASQCLHLEPRKPHVKPYATMVQWSMVQVQQAEFSPQVIKNSEAKKQPKIQTIQKKKYHVNDM